MSPSFITSPLTALFPLYLRVLLIFCLRMRIIPELDQSSGTPGGRRGVSSNFLWVGAFCVFVLVCGLCSCCVLTPLIRCYREARSSSRSSSSKRRSAVHQATTSKDTLTPAYAPNGDKRSSAAKSSATHGKVKRKEQKCMENVKHEHGESSARKFVVIRPNRQK